METQETEWVEGNIKLKIYGEPVEMQLTVPAKPVKPKRMLPVFQHMANSFVGIAVEALGQDGKKISCQAGCGACCRQPVPLAQIEARQIAELVENMPEPRRTVVKERFAKGLERLHEINWMERMDNIAQIPIDERLDMAMEYFRLGIPCPFLEDESCSIHPDRPLACREYLVTSPPENCSNPTVENIEPVPIALKPTRASRRIGNDPDPAVLDFVTMIRSLEWVEKHPDLSPEKTGPEWMGEFFSWLADSEIPKDDTIEP